MEEEEINTEDYLREFGENASELEKQFIPRCINWEAPSPDVDRAIIRIGTSNIPMKRYMVNNTPNFYHVLILTVDKPSITYGISWAKGHGKLHEEFETILEEKTADEATPEFDTIEKGSLAMDLLYKTMYPSDLKDNAVFLKKYSSERVNETVVWTEKLKPRIHEAEVEHVNHRIKNAEEPLKEWLAKQLGIECNVKVPRIALCASGGGLRASIATRFFVDQLVKEGLLPAIAYMTTLSGSTWFMTDWLVNKQILPSNGPPWVANTRDVLGTSDTDALQIGSALAWHNSWDTNLYEFASWFIELWANVIGHGYLTFPEKVWDPNVTRFSKIAADLATTEGKNTYPWPIMTTVGESEKEWFEFTPVQIGRLSLGSKNYTYLDPVAFGCKIQDGKKLDSPPGDELGQLMATWGSAVTLELDDLSTYVSPCYGRFGKIWGNLTGQKYLCPPLEVYNWENPNSNKLVLRDGGLGINVPYPPAVEPERGIDFIIALDVSADCWENPAGTLDLFSQWVVEKKHPNFQGKTVPRFTPKTEAEKQPLRQSAIYNLGGVWVVYLPIAIENAETRVSTYKAKHDTEAQKLIYDTVMEKWNSIKGPMAEFIQKHFSE